MMNDYMNERMNRIVGTIVCQINSHADLHQTALAVHTGALHIVIYGH